METHILSYSFPEEAIPSGAEILSQQEEGVEVRITNATGARWDITIPFSNSTNAGYNYYFFQANEN